MTSAPSLTKSKPEDEEEEEQRNEEIKDEDKVTKRVEEENWLIVFKE